MLAPLPKYFEEPATDYKTRIFLVQSIMHGDPEGIPGRITTTWGLMSKHYAPQQAHDNQHKINVHPMGTHLIPNKHLVDTTEPSSSKISATNRKWCQESENLLHPDRRLRL